MSEPTFRVRAKAKSSTWFDPADDRLTNDIHDRPDREEICLGVWEEAHGHGYAVKEVVISYRDLPALYEVLNSVLAGAIQRITYRVEELEAEMDEYKAALHRADLEAYMEIFTRRAERP